jgi:hypothetical protein
MKRLIVAMFVGLFLASSSYTPVFAQGKGRGKQTGPKDGSGKQQGKGGKGKQTGPKDGTGPIHTPPKQ